MLLQLELFSEGSGRSAEWAGEEFPLRSDRRQRIGDGGEGLTDLQQDPVLSQDCCIQVLLTAVSSRNLKSAKSMEKRF